LLAFFQTGGLGDAILGTGPMRRLIEDHGPIVMAHCERLIPQVTQGMDGILFNYRIKGSSTVDDMRRSLPGVTMVVANKFLADHRGRPSFFIPLHKSMEDEAEIRYLTYCNNFQRDFSMPFAVENFSVETIRRMSAESYYFVDWNRFGFNVGYEDVRVDIHDYTRERNEKGVDRLGKYVIVHDSRLVSGGTYVKAWEYGKWEKVCEYLREMGLFVVQMMSSGQDKFHECVIPHCDIIGKNAMFQDYLYLLSRSAAYIGTDSWPGHAAIFLRDPKYILIKGGVSKRWDHNGSYAEIIRKGDCQACEGPTFTAHSCVWGRTDRECMSLITPEDVMERLKNVL